MAGGLTLKGEQAKAVVLERYPKSFQVGIDGSGHCVIVSGTNAYHGRSKISGYCKTFSAAWISAERRISKGKK